MPMSRDISSGVSVVLPSNWCILLLTLIGQFFPNGNMSIENRWLERCLGFNRAEALRAAPEPTGAVLV